MRNVKLLFFAILATVMDAPLAEGDPLEGLKKAETCLGCQQRLVLVWSKQTRRTLEIVVIVCE